MENELVVKVLEQLEADIGNSEISPLESLLGKVPEQALNEFLAEKRHDEIVDIQQPKTRRQHDRTLLAPFEKWESLPELDFNRPNGYCGNIKFECSGADIYDSVSAPMSLARLVAAGCTVHVVGQEGYKVTWEVILKHKETGEVFYFNDYKGGTSTGSSWPVPNDKKQQFFDDVRELCQVVVNPKFPHPYDGCVVGEIA